ncbi:OX-2 membrane glycoprotein-like isoform X1 [Salarias fasciatus]|uniref:OX-2 membrane glycoprotein-like isoform X1 n=2 Tax=Salarias fasciatus TaxID=181472 RepID=UPI0011766415|nr:OX-2 membrane glycoprotein-like isoform X1 [Salarias fasciatus]XP_029941650.1 OX-2 membrane glycoprotein-like isoform X1 [Salarias fasciatus]XP_029941652.1 OX-2 membrane glycoprotein-like isoform X1 [Salarias fasciatus]XP_029941653.1 OX-2 membrane glycoprotein-like isoform X1 [Salarias fasciatus]XP_029941654.1 OX-2 membrane glycoprotein-like isoform X1 [Salarias fasciatus]
MCASFVFERKQMLLLFFMASVCCPMFAASSSQISGFGDETAEYGGEAHYSCSSADPTGVRQVTWQRLFSDQSVENLATFSPRFGQQVNEPYGGKVFFTEAALNSTAITVSDVTWQDESCYVCSFNVFPDGSRGRQTCLTVQGISEANMSMQTISGAEEHQSEVAFSCSATGKPAPSIQWELPSGVASSSPEQTQTVKNADRTFISSSSITLRLDAPWKGQVDCVLNRGKPGQRTERIPLVVQHEESEDGTGHSHVAVVLSVCVVTVMVCVIVAVVAGIHKRWKRKVRDEAVI